MLTTIEAAVPSHPRKATEPQPEFFFVVYGPEKGCPEELWGFDAAGQEWTEFYGGVMGEGDTEPCGLCGERIGSGWYCCGDSRPYCERHIEWRGRDMLVRGGELFILMGEAFIPAEEIQAG